MNDSTNEQTNNSPPTARTPAEIADELLGSMPEPQPGAMAQALANENSGDESAPESVNTSGEKDSAGIAWNPDVHATGPDGKGVLTAKGEWRRRRGVGKRSSVAGVPTTGVPPSADTQAARAAGVACAHSLLMMGTLLGGAEWNPRILKNDDGSVALNEAEMMEKAFGDYFVAKNTTEFPPGLALTMALTAYAMPRFTMPQTRSRLQRAKEWAAAKYAKWKVRKQPKDKQPEPRTDSGQKQSVR